MLYCCEAIKLAAEAMAEPLHTLIFRNISTQNAIWVYMKRQVK